MFYYIYLTCILTRSYDVTIVGRNRSIFILFL